MKVGSRVSMDIDPHFTGTVIDVSKRAAFCCPLFYVKWDLSNICPLPYARRELREVK